MLRKGVRALFLGVLPFMVGCPGRLEPGYKADQPVDQNSLGFGYVGENAAVNGQWGISWGIGTSPSVNAPARFRFQGPGALADGQRNPIDLTKEYFFGGGIYIPPADVPPEGAVAKVGCEVLSPITKRWEKSPDYEIRVAKKTTPMDFLYGVSVPGDATSATVKAGTTITFGITIRPRPAIDPQVQWVLVPPLGFTGDVGTMAVRPWWGTDSWAFDYTAPAPVAAPMDVIVRTTAYDPWIQQTRTVDFTLHMVP